MLSSAKYDSRQNRAASLVGVLDRDLDQPGGEQPLDARHRLDEIVLLPVAERRQQRAGERVAAPVELRDFGVPGGGA